MTDTQAMGSARRGVGLSDTSRPTSHGPGTPGGEYSHFLGYTHEDGILIL
jgi:hypothetical protein